jgi:hypothetical protein
MYVKLVAKPNTWFKEGTDVWDEDTGFRFTKEKLNEWAKSDIIVARGSRICESETELQEIGVEYTDSELCEIDEFTVILTDIPFQSLIPDCDGRSGNKQIQFYEDTWCLKKEGGGFDGYYNTKAVLIAPEPFNVLSIYRDKKRGFSDIHVWSDGCMDGRNYYLINVPNGLFREISNDNPKF